MLSLIDVIHDKVDLKYESNKMTISKDSQLGSRKNSLQRVLATRTLYINIKDINGFCKAFKISILSHLQKHDIQQAQ